MLTDFNDIWWEYVIQLFGYSAASVK